MRTRPVEGVAFWTETAHRRGHGDIAFCRASIERCGARLPQTVHIFPCLPRAYT